MSWRQSFRISLLLLLCLSLSPPARGQQTPPEDASSCVRCHSRMDGRLTDLVDKWRGSIHAGNGIGCHSCHGGDPTIDSMEAMSPARGYLGAPAEEEIPAFCGKCHAGVEEDYRASAHGQALGAGGPQCVTCHGNHAVQQATLELINRETCTACHGYERAETSKAALAQTDDLIGGLDRDISRLRRVGIDTEDVRGKLFAIRNDFHRLFHSVDVPKIVQQTEDFQGRLGKIREQVDDILALIAGRRRIGVAVVGLLALTTLVSWLLRRTYKKEEERGIE